MNKKSWSEHRKEVGLQRMRNMLQEHTGRVVTKDEIERLILKSGIPYAQGGPESPRGTRRLWSLPDAHKVIAHAMYDDLEGPNKNRATPPAQAPGKRAAEAGSVLSANRQKVLDGRRDDPFAPGAPLAPHYKAASFHTGQADEILDHLFQKLEDGKRYRVGVFEV